MIIFTRAGGVADSLVSKYNSNLEWSVFWSYGIGIWNSTIKDQGSTIFTVGCQRENEAVTVDHESEFMVVFVDCLDVKYSEELESRVCGWISKRMEIQWERDVLVDGLKDEDELGD
eukprot:scaffold8449_cov23-Cyclotella_meneghiniana.AAC.2